MTKLFRRSATHHRPAVTPAPGTAAYEVEAGLDGIDVVEDADDDWAQWEDSVQQWDSGLLPIDPFERVSRRGG